MTRLAFCHVLVAAGFYETQALAEHQLVAQSPGGTVDLVLVNPTDTPGPVSESALIEAFSKTFKNHTSLRPRVTGPEVLVGCRNEPVCLQRRADVVMDEPPDFLLILSNIGDSNSNSVRIRLVPIADRSLPIPDFGESIELRAETETASVAERLMKNQLRPLLESSKHFEPWGSIRVTCSLADAEVFLDGERIGTIGPDGESLITHVLPGSRNIEVVHSDWQPVRATTQVPFRGQSTVAIPMVEKKTRFITVNDFSNWGGGLLALLGTATIVYAFTETRVVGCVGVDGAERPPDCGTDTLTTFGRSATLEARGSVPISAVGVGLLAAGATWLIGTLLSDDQSEGSWILVLSGVGIGVVGGLAAGLAGQ